MIITATTPQQAAENCRVKQERTIKPVVKATDFKVEFGLNTSFSI
jgi:hypothetical protein